VNQTSLPPEIGPHNSKNFSTTKDTKFHEARTKRPFFVALRVL